MDDNKSIQRHHNVFSVAAHNQAMDIVYGENPSAKDIHSLIELTHVAHYHWMRRDDKTPQNVSVALWAVSRAYAANGFAERALEYAQLSLQKIASEDLLPSYYGYCHEALARAYQLNGDPVNARGHYNEAMKLAEQVPDAQAKEYLLVQINQIQL